MHRTEFKDTDGGMLSVPVYIVQPWGDHVRLIDGFVFSCDLELSRVVVWGFKPFHRYRNGFESSAHFAEFDLEDHNLVTRLQAEIALETGEVNSHYNSSWNAKKTEMVIRLLRKELESR